MLGIAYSVIELSRVALDSGSRRKDGSQGAHVVRPDVHTDIPDVTNSEEVRVTLTKPHDASRVHGTENHCRIKDVEDGTSRSRCRKVRNLGDNFNRVTPQRRRATCIGLNKQRVAILVSQITESLKL